MWEKLTKNAKELEAQINKRTENQFTEEQLDDGTNINYKVDSKTGGEIYMILIAETQKLMLKYILIRGCKMEYKFVTYDKEKNWLKFFYNNDEWFKKFALRLGYDKFINSYDIKLLIFSQIPNITKADILELFELSILCCFWASRIEGNEIMI